MKKLIMLVLVIAFVLSLSSGVVLAWDPPDPPAAPSVELGWDPPDPPIAPPVELGWDPPDPPSIFIG